MSGPSPEAATTDTEQAADRPAPDRSAVGTTDAPTTSDEVARLEELLAERARLLEQQRGEAARLQGLLRDALGHFEEVAGKLGGDGAGQGDAQLVLERDRAVARALEAEAARAEASLRLDEAMGFLAEAREQSVAPPALESDHAELDRDNARLSGTARGLTSALAEMEEAREMAEARLLLLEHDLEDAQERNRALQRELAEAREQLELQHAELHGLQRRSAASADGAAVERDTMLGELAGLRARGAEAEQALEVLLARKQRQDADLAELRKQLGVARAQLGAASSGQSISHERLEELERSINQEREKRRELDQELSAAKAERLMLQDELTRARGEVESVKRDLAEAHDERQRSRETLEAQRDAAQRGTAEQRRRVQELRLALQETRAALEEIEGQVRSAARREERASDPSELVGSTQPGVPVHIEAIEALEERVAARDDRIRMLEEQLSEANEARAAAEDDHAGAINKVNEKAGQLATELEAASRRLKAFEEVARGLHSSAEDGPVDAEHLAALFGLINAH